MKTKEFIVKWLTANHIPLYFEIMDAMERDIRSIDDLPISEELELNRQIIKNQHKLILTGEQRGLDKANQEMKDRIMAEIKELDYLYGFLTGKDKVTTSAMLKNRAVKDKLESLLR